MQGHIEAGQLASAIRSTLLEQLREKLAIELIRPELEEYEAKLREHIKPTLESLTVEHVEVVKDALKWGHDLRILIKILDADNL